MQDSSRWQAQQSQEKEEDAIQTTVPAQGSCFVVGTNKEGRFSPRLPNFLSTKTTISVVESFKFGASEKFLRAPSFYGYEPITSMIYRW